eukprot:Nk52_evm30s236 gene=Nk52_evmTU30s236
MVPKPPESSSVGAKSKVSSRGDTRRPVIVKKRISMSKMKPKEYSVLYILVPALVALSGFTMYESLYSYLNVYRWEDLTPPGHSVVVSSKATFENGYKVGVNCSDDYDMSFEKCSPVKCGRAVYDGLFDVSDLKKLKNMASEVMSKYGGSTGGPTILDLHSGALSKGEKFVNVYKVAELEKKRNPDSFTPILTEEVKNAYEKVKNIVQAKISEEFGCENLYLTKPTFFSRISGKKAVTMHDEYWHPHIDKLQYGTFYYTSLVYLNDYETDFLGGRFVFDDDHPESYGVKAKKHTPFKKLYVEPRKGRLSFFTSGSENVHHVEKVTEGFRFAITISFTCEKKHMISQPGV